MESFGNKGGTFNSLGSTTRGSLSLCHMDDSWVTLKLKTEKKGWLFSLFSHEASLLDSSHASSLKIKL